MFACPHCNRHVLAVTVFTRPAGTCQLPVRPPGSRCGGTVCAECYRCQRSSWHQQEEEAPS